MKQIALLGGSFNPPHIAHQMLALWALSTGKADEVWLVPCYQHPLGKPLIPFAERVEMCWLITRLFLSDHVKVCRVEETIKGPSRTLLTLQHLMAHAPEHRFSLLIGADILQEKESWYRFDEIEKLAPILVVGRSGYPSPEGSLVLPDISSTIIRDKLLIGEDVSALVPRTVLEYIHVHQLYRRQA